MSVLVEFSIVPIGKGESLSPYIAKALRIVAESGVSYRLNPMGTVLEGEWDELMEIVKKCHQQMRMDADRVLTTIKIDDRAGQNGRIGRKIETVEQVLGHTLNK